MKFGKGDNRIRRNFRQPTRQSFAESELSLARQFARVSLRRARRCRMRRRFVRRGVGPTGYCWEYKRALPFAGRAGNNVRSSLLRAQWLGEKRDVLVKLSRLFWIFVLSGAVLIGGAAWLSAHWLSAPGAPAATEERVAADLGSPRSRPGAGHAAPETARPLDAPAVGAGDREVPPSSSGADVHLNIAPQAAGAHRPADGPGLEAEADEVAAPPRGARSKDAVRVNPTSGEQMWSARDVIPDGGRPDQPLCGGKMCAAGQFCCGPPECGRCAYPMAGPRCPGVCPGPKRN